MPVVDVEGAALHRKIEYEQWEAANGAATLLARDLVVHEGGLPVQLAATAGRVNRLTVPKGDGIRDLGHVLVGRKRAFTWRAGGGRPVAAGAARGGQPEGDTHRAGTAGRPAAPVEDEVIGTSASRGTLASRRRAFVEEPSRRSRSSTRLSRRAERAPAMNDDVASLNAAIVEASLAIAGGATVIVLTWSEHLNGARERELAESLAAELARRGVTVVLLGARRTETGAGPSRS